MQSTLSMPPFHPRHSTHPPQISHYFKVLDTKLISLNIAMNCQTKTRNFLQLWNLQKYDNFSILARNSEKLILVFTPVHLVSFHPSTSNLIGWEADEIHVEGWNDIRWAGGKTKISFSLFLAKILKLSYFCKFQRCRKFIVLVWQFMAILSDISLVSKTLK